MLRPVPLKHMQPAGHVGRKKRDLVGGRSTAKLWRTASCLPALPHGLPWLRCCRQGPGMAPGQKLVPVGSCVASLMASLIQHAVRRLRAGFEEQLLSSKYLSVISEQSPGFCPLLEVVPYTFSKRATLAVHYRDAC